MSIAFKCNWRFTLSSLQTKLYGNDFINDRFQNCQHKWANLLAFPKCTVKRVAKMNCALLQCRKLVHSQTVDSVNVWASSEYSLEWGRTTKAFLARRLAVSCWSKGNSRRIKTQLPLPRNDAVAVGQPMSISWNLVPLKISLVLPPSPFSIRHPLSPRISPVDTALFSC